jgi:hypothetical protein
MKIGDARGYGGEAVGDEHPAKGVVEFAALDCLGCVPERAEAALLEIDHAGSSGAIADVICRSRANGSPRDAVALPSST